MIQAKNKIRGFILLILAVVIFLNFNLDASLNWMIFLAFLFYGWENCIVAFGALIFLISCPILLAFHQDKLAETMAVQAYLFLVMAVILQVVELKRKKEVGEVKEVREVREISQKILTKKNNFIFWIILFSKKALKILVPISVAFLVSSIILLAFSQKKLAETFYFLMLVFSGLIAVALIVSAFGKNKIKK